MSKEQKPSFAGTYRELVLVALFFGVVSGAAVRVNASFEALKIARATNDLHAELAAYARDGEELRTIKDANGKVSGVVPRGGSDGRGIVLKGGNAYAIEGGDERLLTRSNIALKIREEKGYGDGTISFQISTKSPLGDIVNFGTERALAAYRILDGDFRASQTGGYFGNGLTTLINGFNGVVIFYSHGGTHNSLVLTGQSYAKTTTKESLTIYGGDVFIDRPGGGVIYKDADGGNCWRDAVSALGSFTISSTTCPENL